MGKIALICGISGQDGGYLAQLLLSKGYVVFGTSRDAQGTIFSNLISLGIFEQVKLLSMAPEDFHSVLTTMKIADPDEVYFLAGQSSVALSFEQPADTIQSIVIGTLNMLEACRFMGRKIRFYQAGSSECFGDTNGVPANERTPFNPRSPYGVAKASSHWLVTNYREAYGLFACNGILFNHESPLRPERFVTKKIVSSACRISLGSNEKLRLGRLDIVRDWGWAPEYIEAMWKMLQTEAPGDYVIATGCSSSLQSFVVRAFEYVGLDWADYVESDDLLFRPSDIDHSSADPAKASDILGWSAMTKTSKVVDRLMEAELVKHT